MQDPHVDPALDGEHVFILGLDSSTVLTLSPQARRQHFWEPLVLLWDGLMLRDERERVAAVAGRTSWTPWDIDVLMHARTLVSDCCNICCVHACARPSKAKHVMMMGAACSLHTSAA